jgi:hypothetical protein
LTLGNMYSIIRVLVMGCFRGMNDGEFEFYEKEWSKIRSS